MISITNKQQIPGESLLIVPVIQKIRLVLIISQQECVAAHVMKLVPEEQVAKRVFWNRVVFGYHSPVVVLAPCEASKQTNNAMNRD